MIYRTTTGQLPASETIEPDAAQGERRRRRSLPISNMDRPSLPVSEASYLGKRIDTCERMAERSQDSCARRVHMTMAEGYRARLAALESRRP